LSNFQPLQFLDIAKELTEGTTEAHWRTSMGRAYYAVFGFARNNIAGHELPFAKNIHESIIMYFKTSSDPAMKKIGANLVTLYDQRVIADYRYDKTVTKYWTKLPIELADRTVADLESKGFL
jgi:hypothetical protein